MSSSSFKINQDYLFSNVISKDFIVEIELVYDLSRLLSELFYRCLYFYATYLLAVTVM